MSLGRVYKKGKVYLEIELYSYSRHVERDYQLKREVRGSGREEYRSGQETNILDCLFLARSGQLRCALVVYIHFKSHVILSFYPEISEEQLYFVSSQLGLLHPHPTPIHPK